VKKIFILRILKFGFGDWEQLIGTRMKGFEKDLKGWAGALLDGPQMSLIKEVYADFPPKGQAVYGEG
jgi:hypothetical protein